MRTLDLVRTSQANLMRSKLRTTLTIIAVFVGTFTISLTNGVGNGVKSYIDKQLGNVGVENSLIVQAKSSQSNPFSNEVKEYNPEVVSGIFNNALLTDNDIAQISFVKNVQKITPNYSMRVDYVTSGDKKYLAVVNQFIEGLNLDMASGQTIGTSDSENLTIPIRYVQPLGLGDADSALGKKVKIGYKDSRGNPLEKELTVVGVQQESVLGSASLYVSPALAKAVHDQQVAGLIAEGTYDSVLVEFDKNLSDADRDTLKGVLMANNYTAQTIQDQIGTFSKIINGISVGLNVFGIIALFVATFGIVNTLLMAVNERTSEIGLMKALGANSRTVFGMFSLEAASIGFWGALLGILASMGVGSIVNRIASNNFLKDFVGFNLLEFPIANSIAILLGIVALAFLAGTLPSLKASRLDPIKALRYE